MHRPVFGRGLGVPAIALAALIVVSSPAIAQTNLTWDANGAVAGTGGTGTWDAATALWFNGTTFVPWTNGSFNNAIFGGTAGTVTVSGTVDVHNITFNTAGYMLTGGTLNLGGTAPTIAGGGAISSILAGTAGVVTGGTTGTLTLSGASTFTGPLIIRNGVASPSTASVTLGPTASLATTAITLGNASSGVANGRYAVLQNQADNQLANAVVTFDGAASKWAYWQLLGTAQSALGLNDASTAGVIENTETQAGFGNSVLTLTGAGTYSYNGYFRDGFGGGGTIGLVKNGSSTQTLAGGNIHYTGATTVNGGTLSLNNATAYRSDTTVNSGATLGLAGNVNAAHTYTLALNDGSTLDKTNSGYNTFNNSNVAINGTVAINVTNSGASNQLFVGGVGTGLTGSGTINLTNTGSATTGLTLRTGPGSFSGTMNVNGGVLNIGDLSGSAGLALQNADLNLANAARLNLGGAFAANGTNASVQNLAGDATTTVTLGAQTLTLGTNNATGANFAGVISGTGAVVKTGTGTQTFTGNNTYGATVINGGTLFIGDGGPTGTLGTGAVTDNANLVFNRSNTMTVAGAISGTGTVTQAGTGTTVLAANSSYSGATTVSSGTLQVGAGGAAGSLGTSNVAINTGATLQFFRSDVPTFANNLSGSGNVSFLGTGVSLQSDYILTGNNSGFTGAVTIDKARLRYDNANDLGATAPITVLSTGQLYVIGATIANPITLNGTGWLEPTGLLGGMRLQAGAVVSGPVTLQSDSSITAYNSSGTISGVISGNANLTKANIGTVVFTGANTYTGTTTISGGTLQIGGGGASGTLGSGGVVDNAALVFSRSDDIAYAGGIAGTGTVTKSGAGALTLTGANTYTGATAVNTGSLFVNGSLGNTAVTVASGATLGGSGSIAGATTIAAGGTLAPGATAGAAGALATGPLGLTNTSILAYDLGAANVVGPQNDVVNVTGNLTLDGTINITDAGTFATVPGSYRLFNYTGTLTNNTLTVGTTPGYASGEAVVQTVVPGKVNLVVSSGMNVAFWDGGGAADDGAIAGGTQTWNNALGNWTNVDGGFNQAWLNGMAVFEATAGTVTLGASVQARALQFSTTGYVINSGGFSLQLNALAGGGAPLVRVDAGLTAMINAPIVGTSGLNKVDTGTLVLAGINTYSGTTTISGGILQIGVGGTTATPGTGAIVNNGTLVINRSNAIAMSNAISGAGDVLLTGGGTLTLSGASSYAGGTTVSRGVLQTASTTAAGTGTVTLGDPNTGASNVAWRIAGSTQPTNNVVVSNNGTGTATLGGYSGGTFTQYFGTVQLDRDVIIQDSTGDRTTLTGVVSGTGNISVAGTRVTFANNGNTDSGVITINAGSVFQLDGNTVARSNTSIVNNGILRLNPGGGATAPNPVIQALNGSGATNSITAGAVNLSVGFNDTGGTYSGVISNGSGGVSITKIGTGTQVLSGTNAYTGTTTISGGTLQIGNGGATGTLGTGAVTDDASLVFNRSNAMTVANAIGGTGTLTQAGSGTTILTGANSYGGTTTISAGALQVGGGGATGNLGSGGVTDNASLLFNRSNAMTVVNAISGTGTLTQAGTGTTTLTGANTYAGLTTISAGTLQIGNGGASGTLGTGSVVDNAALSFSRSDAISYGGAIAGTGTLAKNGAGSLTLTGASAYTGATAVNTGTLFVNGSLGNTAVTTASGATLGGTGSIAGATTIAAGGTLAPGASSGATGALTTGALTLNGTSLLAYDLGAANVIGPQNDVTHVAGNLTVDGTINIADAGTFAATPGSYRLVNYTGALTNNTLNVGTTPGYGPGEAVVQTVIPGKVNLVVSSGMNVAFWDGAGAQDDGNIAGGTQTWNAAAGNWTNVDGGINQAWLNGMAIFDGTAGTVTLGAAVQARALQFSSTGYVVNGSAFSLQLNALPSGAASLIRVDPGVTATINAPIVGTNGLNKADTGTLILGGANTYSGTTTISGGTLRVNGTLTSSPVVVNSGAMLAGSGSISGAVTVNAGGAIAPGNSPGTLTVGSLNLVAGSILNYELDTPGTVGGGVNDLIIVTSNLTLAGTLNVTGLAGFGVGTYRLMNYGGALTDNGLLFGTLPTGFAYAVQTNVAGQVNLAVGGLSPDPIQYWDGSNNVGNGVVDGGSGVWTAGPTNWTAVNGAFNQVWGGQTAVFRGTAGTVTVVGPVAFTGLRFETTGYSIAAGSNAAMNTDTADTVVQLNPGVTATIGVPIGGSGGIDLQGAGTLILAADNTYAGGTIIGAGSTLQLGAGGTSGGIVGAVVDNGTLVFNRSDTLSFGGPISGAGSVVQNGAGTVVLTGANSYLGGTTINAGVVSASSDANLGDASGHLTLNGGTLQTTADMTSSRTTTLSSPIGTVDTTAQSTFTLSGVVNGPGALVKIGSGTLVLSGANTYAGGTAVRGGTASIAADANLGASSGGLFLDNGTLRTTATLTSARATVLGGAGGTFETSPGTSFTLASAVDGAGALTKTGGGTLVLSAANSYAGGTRINGGTISIASDANLGAVAGTVAFGDGTLQTTADMTSSRAMSINGRGTIETATGTTFLLDSGITGGGALTKSGSGRLVLTGASSYGAGTSIAGGSLQLGNCGASGSITGDVRDDGVLAFSRSDRFTFGGAISGSGSVVKNCTGTTILTAANSYTGGTLVAAGTLQGDTRSLQGDVINDAALVFDQAFDGTFRGALFGAGTLTKSGNGAVLLTGNHGLTGSTTIQAGTLALEGTLGGAVTVLKGARFDATGAIGGSLVVDGATIVRSPTAGGFGELGIIGDATFNPGSTYGVGVDANGRNSVLVANGHAAIAGATVAVAPQAGTYGRVTQYAILRGAAGLTGTASATSSAPNLDPYLTQNATTLFLTLLRTDLALQPFAVTGNGWGIGGAIDRLKPGASGDLAVVTRELTALDDRTLGRSLDAISGEIHASATQLAAIDGDGISDTIRSEISTRIGGRGIELGRASKTLWGGSRRRGWFRFRDERAHFDPAGAASGQDDRPGVHGANGSLDGFALAADWSIASGWLVGTGASYARGRLALDGLDERATYAAPRAIAYIGYSWTGFAIDGGISVARTAYDLTRSFQFTAIGPTGRPLFDGVNRQAESAPSGIASEFWTEARVAHSFGRWELQPTVGVRRARYGLDAWSESGADALSLRAPAQAIASLQADFGARFSRSVGRLRPYAGGSARRELTAGHTSIGAGLADRAQGLFDITGLTLPRDTAIGEAGLLFQSDRVGFSLAYVGRRARQQTRHTVQLAIAFE